MDVLVSTSAGCAGVDLVKGDKKRPPLAKGDVAGATGGFEICVAAGMLVNSGFAEGNPLPSGSPLLRGIKK